MRVLHLTTLYPTKSQPSLGIFVKAQIDSLTGIGIENDVFFMTVTETRKVTTWLKAKKMVQEGDYDIVHCHFGYSLLATMFLRDVPLVVSYGGTDVMGGGHSFLLRAKRSMLVAMSNLMGLRAQACIAKSHALCRRLWFQSVRRRCRVIPNGVDFSVFHPIDMSAARTSLGLAPGKRYVLFIGSQQRAVKRADLAQRAITTLVKSRPDVELLKVNGISQEKLNLYYSAADCLLLTSDYEGSPNVVKEALACNLPVVSVDVGDVRELCGDLTGCEIVGRSAENISRGLTAALDRGERINGRTAMEPLRLENIAQRVKDVYRDVIRKEG